MEPDEHVLPNLPDETKAGIIARIDAAASD